MLRALLRYRLFFRQQDVARILFVSFFSRLPIGTMSLGLLMYLSELSKSIAFAGAQVGVYMVAMSVSAPVLGRLIDRYGAKRVLIVCGLCHPVGVWSLFLPYLFPAIFPLHFVTLSLIVAGLFCPPCAITIRSALRYRFPHVGLRHVAFSCDSVLTELNFIVGPALIAIPLSFSEPVLAYVLAAITASLSVPLFFLAPTLKYLKFGKNVKRHILGPLANFKFILLLGINLTVGITLGAIELAYPAFSKQFGEPFWSGILLTCCAAGSAAAGMIYGGMALKISREKQLLAILALMAIFTALHLTANTPPHMLVWAFAAGLSMSPSLTALAILQASYVPERYTAESFTWASTFVTAGIGAGMAIGGPIGESAGIPVIFMFATGAAAVSMLLVVWLMRLAGRSKD